MQYIDYVGSWGPAIVGHAHPEVVEALTEQIKKVRAHPCHPGVHSLHMQRSAACTGRMLAVALR